MASSSSSSSSSWKDGLEDNAIEAIGKIAEARGFDLRLCDVAVSPACKKGDNYLGVVRRVTLADRERAAPEWSFVLKTCPAYLRRMPVAAIYRRELFAYAEVLPYFERMEIEGGVREEERFAFARCLAGDLAPTGEFIALEDLRRDGFVPGSREEALARDQMALLVGALAHLHSLSFAAKRRMPEHRVREFLDEIDGASAFTDLLCPAPTLEAAARKAASVMSGADEAEARARLERFAVGAWDRMKACEAHDSGRPYSVLCHGDCWINNVMFKYENDKPVAVRLVDWQLVRYASPVLDISSLVFPNTDEALRKIHYHGWLDLYYERLGVCLKRLDCDVRECYPENIYRQHIQRFMTYGLIVTLIAAPAFVCEEDDIIDMEEIMDNETVDYDLKNAKSQERYSSKVKGVVKDFIELKMI